MLSKFEVEEVPKEEKNWTLWKPVINAGIERRDKKERDAGRARNTVRRKLLMEHLENNGR